MSEASSGRADFKDDAIREGTRSEKEMSGYGSIAIVAREDKVTPWYRWSSLLDRSSDVTTATGWAVWRKSSRSCCRIVACALQVERLAIVFGEEHRCRTSLEGVPVQRMVPDSDIPLFVLDHWL